MRNVISLRRKSGDAFLRVHLWSIIRYLWLNLFKGRMVIVVFMRFYARATQTWLIVREITCRCLQNRLFSGMPWMAAGLLLLLIAVQTVGAAERPRLQGDGVTIVYDLSLEYQADLVTRVYPKIRDAVETKIGWKLQRKPVIFLIGDSEVFQKMGGGPFEAGLALFPKGHIVLNLASATPHFILLNQTLRHEFGHLLLHERIPGRRLPRWLDEGVCEWLSVTGDEDIVSRKIEGYATAYVLSKQGVPRHRRSAPDPTTPIFGEPAM